MPVPFLNLKAHHDPLRAAFMAAIGEVIDSNAFAGGPFVEAFEADFARYCGVDHAIGVGHGTDALWFAMLALGIGRDDEVITTPSTFIATAEAISFCGARPVFVDIDERTYNLDTTQLEAAITPRTKAIVPVHLFGQMADMDPIREIAARHRLPIIEDAAQAHGATYKGRKAGQLGNAACFSFYPGKNLGAFGEAGAIVTNDADLAAKIRILRDHGQAKKYHHAHIGWNGRMDGIQAAVLQIKLQHIEKANTGRRRCANLYAERLHDVPGITLPVTADYGQPVHHVYAIRVQNRDEVLAAMLDRDIGCAIHYPVPLHLQPAYAHLGYAQGDFPVAERCASQFLSLPMFPELSDAEINEVCDNLEIVLAERSLITDR